MRKGFAIIFRERAATPIPLALESRAAKLMDETWGPRAGRTVRSLGGAMAVMLV